MWVTNIYFFKNEAYLFVVNFYIIFEEYLFMFLKKLSLVYTFYIFGIEITHFDVSVLLT